MKHVAVIKKNQHYYTSPQYKKGMTNEMIRVTQVGKSHREGISAMGTKYERGETILHMSSARSTGEVYTLTKTDVRKIFREFGNKWLRTIKPSKAKTVAGKRWSL